MLIGIGGVSVVQAGVASSFTPKVISGLQLWLDATTGVLDASNNPITVDNTAVKTWQDQSGNNNHALQNTAGSRPLLRLGANGINNLPALQWDTSAKFLSGTATLFSTAVTTFVVVKYFDSTTRYCCIDLKGGYPNHFGIDQNVTPVLNRNDFVAGGTTLYTSGATTTNLQLISVAANTGIGTNPIVGNTTMKANGVTQTLTIGNSYGVNQYPNYAVISNYTIGSFTPGNTLGLKGYLCEVLVYNSVLATTDMTKVEDYLRLKWNIY